MAAQKERRKYSPPMKLTTFMGGMGLFPFLVLLGIEIIKTEDERRGMLFIFCPYLANGISRRNLWCAIDAELPERLSCVGKDVR